MKYAPLNYDKINIAAGRFSPSSIKSFNNYSFWFWSRSLFQRAASVIEFTVPENWEGKPKDFLVYCLFKFGYIAIFNDDRFGLTFQPCTLKGYDWFYQPSECIVANPQLNKEFKLGSERQWDIGDS